MEVVTALVAASLVHLGFQATVTVVVYPGFAGVPAESWPDAHAAHTRRIGPLVAVVYLLLALASGAVVVAGPSLPELVAVGAALGAVLVTALVAAPAHGRLSPDRSAPVLERLLVADRVRLGFAGLGAVASLVAAAG